MSSLRHDLTHLATARVTDKHTIRNYKSAIATFCEWAEERGISPLKDIKGKRVETLNEYSKYLQERGYSAGTIHTYLAPICKGMQVEMDKVDKPKRKAATVSKRRVETSNLQGKRELTQERYNRSVRLSEAVGARRAELARLTYADLVARDESGYRCVAIHDGKGGKDTMQRLTPEQEAVVDDFIQKAREAGLSASERVLTRKELQNHIDYHSLRAQRAQRAYEAYEERIRTEGAAPLIRELVARWNEYHRGDDAIQTRNGKFFIRKGSRAAHFYKELRAFDKLYALRGDNRRRALTEGRPVVYNRLALLAVSVFDLSHWRLDVTVTNYML